MKRPLLLAALAIMAVSVTVPAEAQRRAVAPARDWTRVAAATPEGGFRIGNPDAPVKLVEYMSLACSHCAEFSAESHAGLMQNYVRPGRVSLEYRNIVMNAADVTAAVLTRCAAPLAFFDMSRELLGTQMQWVGRLQQLTPAQRSQLSGLRPAQLLPRLAPLLGLDRVAARYGIPAARQQACLSNQANVTAIERLGENARSQFGVTGTPTFLINGQVVSTTNLWSGIEPLLRQAGASR